MYNLGKSLQYKIYPYDSSSSCKCCPKNYANLLSNLAKDASFLQKEVRHAGITFYVKTGFFAITLMTGNSWF